MYNLLIVRSLNYISLYNKKHNNFFFSSKTNHAGVVAWWWWRQQLSWGSDQASAPPRGSRTPTRLRFISSRQFSFSLISCPKSLQNYPVISFARVFPNWQIRFGSIFNRKQNDVHEFNHIWGAYLARRPVVVTSIRFADDGRQRVDRHPRGGRRERLRREPGGGEGPVVCRSRPRRGGRPERWRYHGGWQEYGRSRGRAAERRKITGVSFTKRKQRFTVKGNQFNYNTVSGSDPLTGSGRGSRSSGGLGSRGWRSSPWPLDWKKNTDEQQIIITHKHC